MAWSHSANGGGTAGHFDEVHAAELAEIELLRARRRANGAAPHDDPDARVGFGVAFSGGGIRSATFNLGVLQALARHQLLRRIDYLSTVSGGGYIGSWLVAWIARSGIDAVDQALQSDDPNSETSRPVKWLREYSNYLTPRLGAFGADTWAAIATYLRNLLLNLLIVIGALTAALLVPHLASPLFQASGAPWALPVAIAWLAATVLALAVHLYAVEDPRRAVLPSGQFWVQLTVVWPALLAVWFGAAWLWCEDGDGFPWWEWSAFTALLHATLWVSAECLSPRPTDSVPPAGSTPSRLVPVEPLWLRTLRVGIFAGVSGFAGGVLLWLIKDRLEGLRATDGAVHIVVTWGLPAVLASFALTVVLHIGLMGRALSDARREWWSRLGGWLMIYNGAWVAAFALTVYGPGVGTLPAWVGAKIGGGLTIGWVMSTVAGLVAGRSAATRGRGGGRLLKLAASVGPYAFILGLATVLALGIASMTRADWLGSAWPLQSAVDALGVLGLHVSNQTAADVASLLFCGFVAALFSSRVDINEFSMHALYRNRLIRCYLGASQGRRTPNEFTGLAGDDDLPLWSLTATRTGRLDGLRDTYEGPYPLINVALNHAAGSELAWQERKASSMVLAPLYCGYTPALGQGQTVPDPAFRQGRSYSAGTHAEHPISLGTAFAISGAAASPNMGYHSSPPLAFLMTIFNVRLGWWLGNPRLDSHWRKPGPRVGFMHLVNELFGYSTDTSGYVYLSDGGHFDNLGIYELVRRRCRYIIACDATADGHLRFEDLGNAIRKCRTDLGAEIDLNVDAIRTSAGKEFSASHYAVGTIRYLDGHHGTIIYLKASLTGREPSDVRDYASVNSAFPHESTADQFFGESQFESYRALGQHAAGEMLDRLANETRDPLAPEDPLVHGRRPSSFAVAGDSAPIPPPATSAPPPADLRPA